MPVQAALRVDPATIFITEETVKPASILGAIIFGLVALAHLLRLILGVEVIAGGYVIPLWISIPGFLVPGALAVALWRESRRSA